MVQEEHSLNVGLGQVKENLLKHIKQFDLNPGSNRELLQGFTQKSGKGDPQSKMITLPSLEGNEGQVGSFEWSW